ncbi:hypothetical protein OH77DRAFT_786128 [Trametes cingulata]|nr:hypothetical protein OH77DRAFT_786128 [Trametes cingulata]
MPMTGEGRDSTVRTALSQRSRSIDVIWASAPHYPPRDADADTPTSGESLWGSPSGPLERRGEAQVRAAIDSPGHYTRHRLIAHLSHGHRPFTAATRHHSSIAPGGRLWRAAHRSPLPCRFPGLSPFLLLIAFVERHAGLHQ